MNHIPSPEILACLSTNVKLHRHRLGITQQELADRCDLNRDFVSNVEKGTVNITTVDISIGDLAQLASGFDCQASDLLERNAE